MGKVSHIRDNEVCGLGINECNGVESMMGGVSQSDGRRRDKRQRGAKHERAMGKRRHEVVDVS